MKFFNLFKLFQHSFSGSVNDLSKVDPRILKDMGISAPYATAFSLRAPFDVGNHRV